MFVCICFLLLLILCYGQRMGGPKEQETSWSSCKKLIYFSFHKKNLKHHSGEVTAGSGGWRRADEGSGDTGELGGSEARDYKKHKRKSSVRK